MRHFSLKNRGEGVRPGEAAPTLIWLATAAVLAEVGKTVPVMEKDVFLHPYIEYLKDFIHSGGLIRVAEQVTGALS